MSTKTKLPKVARRLSAYWKMEAGNVLLLPAFMLVMARGNLGWATALACIPMLLLLAIGAAYWRAKFKQLTEPGFQIERTLRVIGKLQPVALALTLLSIIPAVGVWAAPQFAIGRGDQIAASFASLLAVLEYVNYYHRQLQHFDNLADFRRLGSGTGFRRSQMARDLDRLQK